MKDLVIIGRGSHANGIRKIVDAINEVEPTWNLIGYLDDNYRADGYRYSVMGPVDVRVPGNDVHYIVAINDSAVRKEVASRVRIDNAATLIHPTAIIGSDTYIGPGCVIHAGAIITGDVRLYEHVHLNVGVTVSQGTMIERFSTLSPGVNVAGQVGIGVSCHIGTGACIINLVTLADNITVGAGAVVVDSFYNSGIKIAGVPAKEL